MIQEAVVEAVWHNTGVAAGHQRVVGGDEIAAVEALAGRLDATDVLVTADSLHPHERLARKIRARSGHWLLVIKLNQPTVHANLTRLPWEQAPDLVTITEKAHGRVEVRSLKVLTVTTPRLVGFWGTKQVVELRRRTRRKKTVTSKPAYSEEVFYLVTSLPPSRPTPATSLPAPAGTGPSRPSTTSATGSSTRPATPPAPATPPGLGHRPRHRHQRATPHRPQEHRQSHAIHRPPTRTRPPDHRPDQRKETLTAPWVIPTSPCGRARLPRLTSGRSVDARTAVVPRRLRGW
ncbi:hypothetical protein FRACA_90010 [Frankia canadensis]|uniref:Transposase IS4-like domain-containing protein n=1 Tax=Frankia canadensis TaxID=1836972 RepID=A0A2I2L2B4_9ACTN|nr:hypothetical protein [Frankia canadensis]SNQ52007.1 hypothetical protein FRACA_90010 [Frankia canadensis]SOU59297.1 hypothetical protein FRACA_90010 [Frankia canadensis]